MDIPQGDPKKAQAIFMSACEECHTGAQRQTGGRLGNEANMNGIVSRVSGSEPG